MTRIAVAILALSVAAACLAQSFTSTGRGDGHSIAEACGNAKQDALRNGGSGRHTGFGPCICSAQGGWKRGTSEAHSCTIDAYFQ